MKFKLLLAAMLGWVSLTSLPTASAASNIKPEEVDAICAAMEGADYLAKEMQVLLSHDEGGAVYSRAVSIPAGVYDIDTISYEGQHPDPADIHDVQIMEQWYVELYSGEELIHTTETTLDVPADSKTVTSNIGSAVSLPTDIDRVVYVHAAFNDPVHGPLYNSVVPSCIGFYEVSEVTPAVCEITMLADSTNTLRQIASLTINGTPFTKLAGNIVWGDGSTSDIESLNPDHTYASGGNYTVVANIVDDENSTAICTATINITVPGATIVLGDTDTDTDNSGTQVLGATDSNTEVLADTGVSINLVSMALGIIMLAIGIVSLKSGALATELAGDSNSK